ncbi:MAG: alanine racemase [Ekhidna sp.]|nr:alanine racemase [Ekhidna sp.]
MDLKIPTLLIDKTKCQANIDQMLEKASRSKAEVRPHFKTHFSADIAELYRSSGVTKCTVSSVSMATYFAEHGWNDITIAFPYNPLEAREIDALAEKIKLNILIVSEDSLKHAQASIKNHLGYFLKIDIGTHRTGINPENTKLIKSLIDQSSEQLTYRGFLAHAGHTYGARDLDSIQEIFNESTKMLTDLQNEFGGLISYGDTPSCSLMEDLSFCDEIRAGNFVFYDWMQRQIGSCDTEQIAVCLAAPVVAIHEDRHEIVVYGGGVHLSKDMIIEKDADGKDQRCFGKMVALTSGGWSTEILGSVVRLSQEHGIIKLPIRELSRMKVGDVIGILPVHSCLAADLQGYYVSTEGERVEKMIKN